MSAKIYMLLDILEGKSASTIQHLRSTDGVVVADLLEGHPNVLLVIEAPDRQKLVELIMPVLSSIERVTEDLHLLMTRENGQVPSCFNAEKIQSLSSMRYTKILPRMQVTPIVS